MIARRLVVDVPVDAERRDRIERAVFEQLDARREALAVPASDDRRDRIEHAVFSQLAGIRGADRAELVAPLRARPRRWVPYLALAGVAAAAAVALILRGGGEPDPSTPSASLIVVPPGQTTRFSEGDAVIVAGGDTSVEVARGANAAVTLTLARGSVECSVEPRGERAPFQVVSGDVIVTVVGTHFTVTRDRTGGTRVDVTHGKVRVTSPTGEAFVTAGETWPAAITAEVQPPPAPPAPAAGSDDEIVMDPAARPHPTTSPKDAFHVAAKLEATDRNSAARAFRQLANGRDTWAASALARLVDVERDRGRSGDALRAIEEYLRRFPRGPAVEDLLWTRVEIERVAKRDDRMRAAAAAYLKAFPQGTYAKPAHRFASP